MNLEYNPTTENTSIFIVFFWVWVTLMEFHGGSNGSGLSTFNCISLTVSLC